MACWEESKLAEDAFEDLLGGHLHNRGYEFAAHGEAQWNGVAILSRVGLDDVVAGIEGAPRLPAPRARAGAPPPAGHPVHPAYAPHTPLPTPPPPPPPPTPPSPPP